MTRANFLPLWLATFVLSLALWSPMIVLFARGVTTCPEQRATPVVKEPLTTRPAGALSDNPFRETK